MAGHNEKLALILTADTNDLHSKLDRADRRVMQSAATMSKAAAMIDSPKARAARNRFVGENASAASNVSSSWNRAGGNVESVFSSMNRSMRNTERAALRMASRGLAVAGVALVGVGVKAVKTAGEYEQARVAFTRMLGSASAANGFIVKLQKFAASTPFEFKDVQEYSKKLLGMGFSAREVIPTLTTLGNAVAGIGGNQETLGRLVLALSQVRAKGKIMAQEMNQFAESGIGAWGMLAKGMNKSVAEVMDMTGPGGPGISAAKALPILMKGINAKFGGMMQEQSKTILGLWSNMKDKIGYAMVGVGDAIIKEFDVAEKIKQITAYVGTDEFKRKSIEFVGAAASMAESLGRLAKTLYDNRNALKTVAVGGAIVYGVFRSLMIASSVASAVKTLSGALTATAASSSLVGAGAGSAASSMGKFGLAGRGVISLLGGPGLAATAAAATGFVALKYAVDRAEESDRKAHDSAQSLAGAVIRRRDASQRLQNAQIQIAKANEIIAASDSTAKRSTQQYKDAINDRKIATLEAAKAQRDLNNATNDSKKSLGVGNGKGDKKNKGGMSNIEQGVIKADYVESMERYTKANREYLGLLNQLDTVEASRKNALREISNEMESVNRQYDAGHMSNGRYIDKIRDLEQQFKNVKKASNDYKQSIKDAKAESDKWKSAAQTSALALGMTNAPVLKTGNTFQELSKQFNLLRSDSTKTKAHIVKELSSIGVTGPMSESFATGILKTVSKAELNAKFGTSNINEILSKAGYAKPNGTWNNKVKSSAEKAVGAARSGKNAVNRELSGAGMARANTSAWYSSLLTGIQNAINAAKNWIANNPLSVGIKTVVKTLKGHNGGGYIPGRGPNRDTVPTSLTKGEFVMQRSAVDRYGVDTMQRMNQGVLGLNKGGMVARKKTKPVKASNTQSYIQKAEFNADDSIEATTKKISQTLAALTKAQLAESAAAKARNLASGKLDSAKSTYRNNKTEKNKDKLDARQSEFEAANNKFLDVQDRRRSLAADLISLRAQKADSSKSINDLIAQAQEEGISIPSSVISKGTPAAVSEWLDAKRKEIEKQKALADANSKNAQLEAMKQQFALSGSGLDIQLAQAGLTEDKSDDRAAAVAAMQNAANNAASLQAFIAGGGLTVEELTSAQSELASSLQAQGSYAQQIKELDAAAASSASGGGSTGLSSFTGGDSAASGDGGGGGGDNISIQRTGGGAGGVGYVPNPVEHPVFFGTNQVNDLDFDSTGVGVKIMSINGWDEAEDARIASSDRIGQDGEYARELLLGGSTITIKGIIVGSDLQDFYSRRKTIKQMFQPQTSESVLKMPDPVYPGVLAVVYSDEMTGYQRKECRVVESVKWGDRVGGFGNYFEVVLRSSDPRRYDDVLVTETTGTISTGGGFSSPMSSPLSSSTSGTGGLASFTNTGDYESPAIMRIYANGSSIVNPIIESSDWIIVFEGLTIDTVDYIEIDPLQRTVCLNGDSAASRFQYVDYAETTWGLISEGENNIKLRAASISDPSYLEIEYRPASV